MNTWPITDEDTFKKTTWKLCQMLNADPDLREKCKADRKIAKATLKEAGDFDQIPDEVEVFIMEDGVAAGSNVVNIILPPKGDVPDQEDFEAKVFWPCTWNHYDQMPADPM